MSASERHTLDTTVNEVRQLSLGQAIADLSQRDDVSLCNYAAWWLGKHRVADPAAIECLLAALADEVDRTEAGGYPLRRNAARALGKLGAIGAVPALVTALSCSDFYVREAAGQALGELKATAAVSPLMAALLAEPEQPYAALLEALGMLGEAKVVPQVLPFLSHDQPRVQFAAARALYQLTGETQYGEHLVGALQHPDLQLRRSALLDLGAIGYAPAAAAIAKTPAENSLKLIALKGIVEAVAADRGQREAVLMWMDSLL